MEPEQWRQIDELLEQALEVPPEGRAAFLNTACGGDEALRREVEKLLGAHHRAGSFLAQPALEAAAREMAMAVTETLMGRTLGHYEVLSRLGAGGMGVVYLARDIRLGREVALKILPAEVAADRDRMQRFIREAKAASALNHPNVATIYDIGEADGISFIAMEYIEGETLQAKISGRPLDLAEIVEFGLQVADALDAAHTKGITHRDIKPANLMLTPRGQVKVLDFGLAKISRPKGQMVDSDIATASGTMPGVVMGTVQFMSPEQVLGREVDHRSDIFSLGVVLYEMATGRLPFAGATVTEMMDRVLHAQPEAISRVNEKVPGELERIARKCLEKERERRYQSARDLLVDLSNLKRDSGSGIVTAARLVPPRSSQRRRLAGAALAVVALALVSLGLVQLVGRDQATEAAIDSIAVLPFANTSGDPDAEYLSDGITESLINSLSQLPKLRVLARTTVFRYKGQAADPIKVRQELGVRAVLTGRVVQRGETLSIQVELVDATNGSQLWGDKYTRKLSDIFAVQDEVAKQISEKLRLKLTGEEEKRLTKRYTENAEAYQLYLRGRQQWFKWTVEGWTKARELFEQAIDKDPNYALAYAGLADAYGVMSFVSPPREAFPKAKATALKALQIDGSLAEAHASLGAVQIFFEWDWPAAEKSVQRAIELNPNLAFAHELYATYLDTMGQTNEAIREMKRAQDLDPLSSYYNAILGATFYVARQYGQAIDQLLKTVEIDPNDVNPYPTLVDVYEQKGMDREALAARQKLLTLTGDKEMAAALGHVYAVSGYRGVLLKWLDELKERAKRGYVSPLELASIYVRLGEKEQALAWLDKAYEDRTPHLIFLKVEPKWDSLRSDPQFILLARRMGLAP